MAKTELLPKDDIFFTKTMAEVLESQGRLGDAMAIYRILLAETPDSSELEDKVKGLEALAKGARRAKTKKGE
ncbi:MAG: hypothetical protein KAS88_00155 [Deltaproteobacteria bacterium]|nr:hypothetical protein [Deltaproteobacteria bacterium]